MCRRIEAIEAKMKAAEALQSAWDGWAETVEALDKKRLIGVEGWIEGKTYRRKRSARA